MHNAFTHNKLISTKFNPSCSLHPVNSRVTRNREGKFIIRLLVEPQFLVFYNLNTENNSSNIHTT